MSLFDASRGTKRGHWLKNLHIREISLVDDPASPGANIILAKRRDGSGPTLAIQPILFAKAGGEADGSSPDEDQLDATEDYKKDEANRRALKRGRKAIRKWAKQVTGVKTFAAAQAPGVSHSGSDFIGAQDDRSPQEHADDTHAIVSTILRSPPVSSENWTTYSGRVFGDAINGFTDDELAAAKQAFKICRSHGALREAAGEALEGMAKSRAAETGRTFHQAYTEVCKSEAGTVLYKAMRDRLVTPGDLPVGIGASRLQKAASYADQDTVASGYPRKGATLNVGGDDADGMSANEANQFIQDAAAACKRANPSWTMQACLHYAGSAHPGVYHRSRGATGR